MSTVRCAWASLQSYTLVLFYLLHGWGLLRHRGVREPVRTWGPLAVPPHSHGQLSQSSEGDRPLEQAQGGVCSSLSHPGSASSSVSLTGNLSVPLFRFIMRMEAGMLSYVYMIRGKQTFPSWLIVCTLAGPASCGSNLAARGVGKGR